MKVVTRSQWGAREPRGRRYDVGPKLGVAIHWPGPGSFTGDHSKCAGYLRAFQRHHMDGNNSMDIEYNWAVCTHGWHYELRQERHLPIVRPGSNGSYTSNSTHGSVVILRGQQDGPLTAQDINTLGEAVAYLRGKGWGKQVVPHRSLNRGTACPGDDIARKIPLIAAAADGRTQDVALTNSDIDKIADRVVAKMMMAQVEDGAFDKDSKWRNTRLKYLWTRVSGRTWKAQVAAQDAAKNTAPEQG